MRICALLVGLSVSAGFASAQAGARADSALTIETRGIGTIKLIPDHAVVTVTVSVRDSSAVLAAKKNGAVLRALLDSLNAFRLPPESVTVVGLSVRPTEDRARAVIVGYDAAAEVHFALRNLERIGPVLDLALRSGATALRDIQFRSEREEAARRDALAIAYNNARSDALALAGAAGLRLGPLLRMSTGGPTEYIASLAESTGWENIAVAPRDIRVNAQVTTSFRLLPR